MVAPRVELYGGLAPWTERAGGGEVVSDALLRSLFELGWKVRGVFLAPDPTSPPDRGYPVTVRRLRRRPVENAWTLARMALDAPPPRETVVQLSCPEAFLAARRLRGRAPLVGTVHHFDPPALPSVFTLRGVATLRRKQRHFMDRALLHACGRVVAVSRSSASCLAERGYVEDASKITVVPNGVEQAWFEVQPSPGAPGPATALFVGRLDHQKGVDVLLEALARVPELALDVAGDGPRMDDYRILAQGLGLADRVTFHGRLAHEAIRGLMARARLFVLPSRAESFGLAALEAMAAGLPVVVSGAGGLPELVGKEGESGLVVPPESPEGLAVALRRLANDPDGRAGMGRMARASALKLRWDRVARRYAEVYLEMLEPTL